MPAEAPLVGPAALNAIPEGTLRSHITALLGQSPGSRSAEAPAILAPFTTYHMLFLMREAVVNMTNGDDWEGWKMQPSLGLGWSQFATAWSSSKDARVGSPAHLQQVLEEILLHEISQRRLRRIPTEAPPPEMKRRTLKQLGTATCDASELAAKSLFSIEEVRLAAIAEQARRDEALEEDGVERQQPNDHPLLDETLVGKRLEVCWKYFQTDDGLPTLIWAPGEVVQVADGTSDKATERCKKMLPAGAVLVKWPEDKDRMEKENLSWHVLIPNKWNKTTQYGWRYDPRDIPRAAPAGAPEARDLPCAAPAAPPPARPAWHHR